MTSAAVTFQVGSGTTSNDKISITMPDADAASLGISAGVTLQTMSKAQAAITAIDTAISSISTERGKLGAHSNRLNNTISNLDQINVNLSASKGRIQDADFATETSNLAKSQILQQAATAISGMAGKCVKTSSVRNTAVMTST